MIFSEFREKVIELINEFEGSSGSMVDLITVTHVRQKVFGAEEYKIILDVDFKMSG